MDEIVTACSFQDSVFIFCRSGKVYRMYYSMYDGRVEFQLVHELFLR